MRIFSTLTVFVALFVTTSIASDYPHKVPCGDVIEMKLSKDDFTLKWDVPKFKERPTLKANETFAEVIFAVAPGYSIGKYDFTLAGTACLAMAEGAGEYNPLNNEYVSPKEAPRTIRMLFKVDATMAPFVLVYTYTNPATVIALGDKSQPVELAIMAAATTSGDAPKTGADKKKKTAKKNAKKKVSKNKNNSNIPDDAPTGW